MINVTRCHIVIIFTAYKLLPKGYIPDYIVIYIIARGKLMQYNR